MLLLVVHITGNPNILVSEILARRVEVFPPNQSRLPEVFATAGIHSDARQVVAACGRGSEQDASRGEAPAAWEARICPEQVACALELRSPAIE